MPYPLPRMVCLSRLLVSSCCSNERVTKRPCLRVQETFLFILQQDKLFLTEESLASSPVLEAGREEAPEGSPTTPSTVACLYLPVLAHTSRTVLPAEAPPGSAAEVSCLHSPRQLQGSPCSHGPHWHRSVHWCH